MSMSDSFLPTNQLIVALQMVVEEKFLGQYDVPPLMAVGWEGVFGMGKQGSVIPGLSKVPSTNPAPFPPKASCPLCV